MQELPVNLNAAQQSLTGLRVCQPTIVRGHKKRSARPRSVSAFFRFCGRCLRLGRTGLRAPNILTLLWCAYVERLHKAL